MSPRETLHPWAEQLARTVISEGGVPRLSPGAYARFVERCATLPSLEPDERSYLLESLLSVAVVLGEAGNAAQANAMIAELSRVCATIPNDSDAKLADTSFRRFVLGGRPAYSAAPPPAPVVDPALKRALDGMRTAQMARRAR